MAEEAWQHGDLLVGARAEQYTGLVYKHVLGLGWLAAHCPALTVIKMDDDISVQLPGLLAAVARMVPAHMQHQPWVAGLLQVSSVRKKYFLSLKIFVVSRWDCR